MTNDPFVRHTGRMAEPTVWEIEREALGLAPSGPPDEETEREIARWDAEYQPET